MSYVLKNKIALGLEYTSIIAMFSGGYLAGKDFNPLLCLSILGTASFVFGCGLSLKEKALEDKLQEFAKIEKRSNREDSTDSIEYFI